MKRFFVATLFIATIIGATVVFFFNRPIEKTKTPSIQQSTTSATDTRQGVDIQASFAIFTNGTKRIFTDSKYHNRSPDVYIESENPDVVKVKKTGSTWDDFFKTLPMKLDKQCLTTGTGQVFCSNNNVTLKFYLNGQLDQDALNKVITNGDKLLVSYGTEDQIRP